MSEVIKANKKQLLKIIRKNCVKCMGSTKAVRECKSVDTCDFYPYRMRPSQMAKQTDIFRIDEKENFFTMILKTAEKMPDAFWFSELRKASKVYPLHYNTWGSVARLLKKHGYYRTGRMRKNPTTSCNSHLEFQYYKPLPF